MDRRSIVALMIVGAAWGCSPHADETPQTSETPAPIVAPATGRTPEPEPEPEPEPVKPLVVASISSVQMSEDCPNSPAPRRLPAQPEPAQAPSAVDPGFAPPPPPAGATAKRRSMARPRPGASRLSDSSGAGFGSHCEQSRMMMKFEPTREGAIVELREVRLVASDAPETTLTTVSTRNDAVWHPDHNYVAWDSTLPAVDPAKVQYDIAVNDWNAVEEALAKLAADKLAADKSQLDPTENAGESALEPGPASSWGRMFRIQVDVAIDGEVQTVESPEFSRQRARRVVT